jgi:hypothetical protein
LYINKYLYKNINKMNLNDFNETSIIPNTPKSKQLVQMLSFRVMPAYFREIEKVAVQKNMTVSKLIRTYIKEGMKRDGELSKEEDKYFTV